MHAKAVQLRDVQEQGGVAMGDCSEQSLEDELEQALKDAARNKRKREMLVLEMVELADEHARLRGEAESLTRLIAQLHGELSQEVQS